MLVSVALWKFLLFLSFFEVINVSQDDAVCDVVINKAN